MNLRSTFNFTMTRGRLLLTSCIITITCLLVTSCENDEKVSPTSQEDKDLARVAAKLKTADFDTSEGFRKFKDGYLIEYDIFMTEEMIDTYVKNYQASKNGRTEHYITNTLVTGTNRTLNVYMSSTFGTYMQNAFDEALSRYNALNLGIRFQRKAVYQGADISILSYTENSSTLANSGFPSGGNPGTQINVNTYYFNASSNRADAATVLAHELGHAIGFRHTDYMNRVFSCGSTNNPNEGTAGVGANHVPGTPTTPEANSWMLACTSGGNRPFTAGDVTALTTVYPRLPGNFSSSTASTYSVIAGLDQSCPVQVTTYYYAFKNFNMMIPVSATLTISGGVFLPSGATSLTINQQVGTHALQVRWDAAGSINAVSRWEIAGPMPRSQYQESITKYVTVNCQ